MSGNRMSAFALATACSVICSAPPASAANYDGSWNMTAVTTRGHCGTIPIGMGISGSRIYSTGGSFAFYSISLGGRVSRSGGVKRWPAHGLPMGLDGLRRLRDGALGRVADLRVCARASGPLRVDGTACGTRQQMLSPSAVKRLIPLFPEDQPWRAQTAVGLVASLSP